MSDLRKGPCPKWVTAIGWFCFALLYLPLLAIVVESFLDHTAGETKFVGLYWYGKVLENPALVEPLITSLVVAIMATVVASTLGATAALSLVRSPMRAKSALTGMFLSPLIMPELVLGIASLVLFVVIGLPLGKFAMIVAHTTFCFSYALVLVQNRLEGFDMRLEEAALDLGASPWRVMREITLPLCWPGVLAAALTAFAMSFDDFLVSFFTAGVGSDTLPMRLYSMVKFGMNPQTYALSSLVLLGTLGVLLLSLKLQKPGASPKDMRH